MTHAMWEVTVTCAMPTCLGDCGLSLSPPSRSLVSLPQLLLSDISVPFWLRRWARGEAGGAERREAHTCGDKVKEIRKEPKMKVLFQTDHALYVLADPPEPPYVAGDEGEGDGVQGVLRRLGCGDRGQVHLHPHLQGKVQGQERGRRQGKVQGQETEARAGEVCKAVEGAGKGKLVATLQ